MSTAFPQHIHTVMFTITLPSTLALLFIYAFLFTMWYFSTITSQLTLQQYFQHILNIYLGYCLQLHYPVYWLCFYICYPFHNMIFFHNYCTIDSTTMSTAYPQHIHTVLLTITLPICWLCCLHMLSFSQCEYFSTHYCTIVYMTMFTFNLLCLHSVLFTSYSPQYTDCALYIYTFLPQW